jgi:hypothetical protein
MSPVQSLTELSLNKVYETSRDAPPNQKASGLGNDKLIYYCIPLFDTNYKSLPLVS